MLTRSDIRLLYVRELRSALRERSIVINTILLPIFLYPLLLWLMYTGVSFVSGQTEGFTSRIMLRGLAPEHQRLKIELERDKQFELKNSADPVEDVRSGSLDALVEFSPPDTGAGLQGNFKARITYDNSKDRSRSASGRLRDRLERYRNRYLETEAGKLGLSPSQLQQFWIESENLATSRQMGQFLLGLMLPVFLIVMLAVGCMSSAIDATAGEREKSTWETLMTTATARTNIVVAKYLYVSTMACVAALLNLAAMLISMRSVLAPILGGRIENFRFQIPFASIPLIVFVTVLLALFIAAGMMILASFARTFKEGQSMVSPLYLGIMMPVMFLQVPGLEFTPLLALIPIVNVTMVFREAVAGVYQWPLIGVTIASEIACIILALGLAGKILRFEDFMIGSYSGKFGKFLKERIIGRKQASRSMA